MTSQSMEMSGGALSKDSTPRERIEEALGVLKEHAAEFAGLSPLERAQLLRACMPRLQGVARRWVDAAAEAKGIEQGTPAMAEEWLAGPMATMRNLRLLAEQLERIAKTGNAGPDDDKVRPAKDGRTEVEVFPTTGLEKALYDGFGAVVRMKEGMTPADVRAKQASFYKKKSPEPGVSLVLGAGNVASIPPMDAFYKMFVEGMVCLVKLNPVNEYLEPFYNEALEPLISRGYLRFVKGGAAEGTFMVNHPAVTDVHVTGSDRTHDAIVWGPTEEERARRKAANDPLLKKPMSSELGSVTPVIVVPGPYSEKEIEFIGENIASMVTNNASCNCNAGKMLVTSKRWPQREALLRRIKDVLAKAKPRKAYYPGAFQRFDALVGKREGVLKLGDAREGELPWAVVEGLDPKSDDSLFTTEPFCPILSEVTLDEGDSAKFLDAAVDFANDRLWGTLSAVIFVHPRSEEQTDVAHSLERAVRELRYGAVGINQWTALAYTFVTTPWGAHPSATLDNIQGGLGWVHNTFMLEGIEKVVVRGPLTVFPKPPWFVTHKRAHEVAEKVVDMEREPSALKLPAIVWSAIRG